MRNIFLITMPPGNAEAMVHYEDTIKRRVSFERIQRHVTHNEAARLRDVFGDRPIAVWGSREGSGNRRTYEKMAIGDDLLIVEGDTIRFIGKIALKTVNPALSKDLWKPLKGESVEGWDLIYFIANPLEIQVPFRDFGRVVGFKENFRLQGFTSLARERIEAFYSRYDDLYSVLLRLGQGKPVNEKAVTDDVAVPPAPPLVPVVPEEVEPVLQSKVISDHVKMQWKLASLGLKAGEKVWVPSADQSKLRSLYNFSQFEPEFAAGIDLPKNYFENIDVVWKEEFRINAAFEVENSTAIYSGLLRFADLNVVAPNTAYPLFIVAPSERRNRVREQVNRPVFRRLDLREKVRFLPYETVDDIDRFFADSTSGLSVALIEGRSESLV